MSKYDELSALEAFKLICRFVLGHEMVVKLFRDPKIRESYERIYHKSHFTGYDESEFRQEISICCAYLKDKLNDLSRIRDNLSNLTVEQILKSISKVTGQTNSVILTNCGINSSYEKPSTHGEELFLIGFTRYLNYAINKSRPVLAVLD